MGAVAKNSESSLMTAQEVAVYLLESCDSLGDFKSFMFGSSLIGLGKDFDILIIGPSDDSLSRLKAELRSAASELPLDVLYMLPEEAEFTDFVAREGCVRLETFANSPRPL